MSHWKQISGFESKPNEVACFSRGFSESIVYLKGCVGNRTSCVTTMFHLSSRYPDKRLTTARVWLTWVKGSP